MTVMITSRALLATIWYPLQVVAATVKSAKASVIVKGEHIAVCTLHDIDIAHKNSFRAIQAMSHDSRDERIRCSTPVHDYERSAFAKR